LNNLKIPKSKVRENEWVDGLHLAISASRRNAVLKRTIRPVGVFIRQAPDAANVGANDQPVVQVGGPITMTATGTQPICIGDVVYARFPEMTEAPRITKFNQQTPTKRTMVLEPFRHKTAGQATMKSLRSAYGFPEKGPMTEANDPHTNLDLIDDCLAKALVEFMRYVVFAWEAKNDSVSATIHGKFNKYVIEHENENIEWQSFSNGKKVNMKMNSFLAYIASAADTITFVDGEPKVKDRAASIVSNLLAALHCQFNEDKTSFLGVAISAAQPGSPVDINLGLVPLG